MSANVYTIESLLIGKKYYSRTLRGEIIDAQLHPAPIWYEGATAYLVEVQPEIGYKTTFRTIALKTGE
jgi:hypothetical protein